MRYSFIISVFCLAFVLMASMLSADVPGKMSYQGYLTNSEGDPLDTSVQIVFTIYGGLGGSKWFEEHIVNVSGGVFSVVLGSKTPIPDSVFNGEERYLGITVGTDPEISPRTLLTSSPQTFISQRMDGDIETSAGAIVFKQSSGDSAIIISAGSDRAHPPEMIFRNVNTEPIDTMPIPLIEMIADPATGPSMGFYDDIGQVMGLDPSPMNEAFSMYLIDPVDEYNLFELTGNYVTDEINMYLIDPVDKRDLLTLSGSHSAGGSLKMYNLQPEPSIIIMEMLTNSTGGPSIYMATPLPEPPPKVLEMSVEEVFGPSPEWAGFFNMFSMDPGDDGREILEISTAASTGASFRMFNPQPEPPAVLLEINANATNGARIDFFDNIGQIMGVEPVPFNSGFSIKLFNPQPEPPAVLLDINSTYGTKGGTSEIALYDDINNVESHLTPGRLNLHHSIEGPPLVLEVDENEARIGIGTNTPSEPLVVGDDLTYFSGNLITVGDDNPTSYAGISFGQDADNRGWMVYDNTDDYIYFGTKEDGVFAPNSIYMKGGDLGIGTSSPDADLHVVGDICYTGSIGTCSDARYKKDINTLSGALEKVSRLRGVSFNWRRDEFPENDFSIREQVGLIAQEVEEVFPQSVSQTNDGYYNIDYTKLTPLLVEAIKELKTQNEKLKSVNEELIRRIEKLESEG
jgi:hypothetical protein